MADAYVPQLSTPTLRMTLMDGNGPIILTGLTPTIHINKDGAWYSGAGTLTVIDAVGGKIQYVVDSTDFATGGSYDFYVRLDSGVVIPNDRYESVTTIETDPV